MSVWRIWCSRFLSWTSQNRLVLHLGTPLCIQVQGRLAFTKMVEDLTSRCTMRLLFKYFNPLATWSVRSTAAVIDSSGTTAASGVDDGTAAATIDAETSSSSASLEPLMIRPWHIIRGVSESHIRMTGSSVDWMGIQKVVEILLHENHNERIILILLLAQQTILTTWGWQRPARISETVLKLSKLASRKTFWCIALLTNWFHKLSQRCLVLYNSFGQILRMHPPQQGRYFLRPRISC
jgi:hypothetical protein